MSQPLVQRRSVVDKIVAATRARVEREKEKISRDALRTMNLEPRQPLDFAAPFREDGLHVIAEVKLATPSEGEIGKNLNPLDVANAYARNGAAAISVLTEPEFFQGNIDYLARIRRDVSVPLLMKDFFVDDYQVTQAWVYGADCVLLIVSVLGRDGLHDLLQAARELGLSALVEVHTEWETETALKEGAVLIGVNNRDLQTLKTDLEVSKRLARYAGRDGVVLISESGIRTREEMETLRGLGYRGFLVGTRLIKSGRPGAALAELLGREAA
ncbi:MAG: indole-3-glycerol phosphate synthase TrpC [Acidobacteriota bacterium]|nr:MAG: indole-3-glycerol phosphate synthase TrpC [Acidobacteriota bacterium]